MKVRAITCFFDPNSQEPVSTIRHLGHLSQSLKQRLQEAGIEVQTCRIATTPFPLWLDLTHTQQAIHQIKELEKEAIDQGFDYLGIGPALLTHPISYALVIPVLDQFLHTFMAAQIADPNLGVSFKALRACGEIIRQAATLTPDGFTNLRFAALANVPSGTPFFPAAYHAAGHSPALALAIESADVVLEIVSQPLTWNEKRRVLLERFEAFATNLTTLITPVLDTQATFAGYDFSPAPFPSPSCSIGTALEHIGASRLGSIGSLSAAALLAETLSRGRWLRSGFNGLMLPVLEDTTLAQRALEGTLTIKDLLLFSAVCGTGLDTVPLPGNTSVAQLTALLADLAFLSARLRKPLTARLMPIPGKDAGEPVQFDFSYFAPGGVMALPSSSLSEGLIANDEDIFLESFNAPA
ncbi:MAG: DUF711 family protein [Thermanaerothrix sp.]|uniref:DUF711 family protein n=1 Tax=Thermanaerothrix sp. TaxID=2972675 RepID=UPI003C7D622E